MITLKCDKCDKMFEIEDDAAGEKASCPYCGDVNRVPADQPSDVSIGRPTPVSVAPETAAVAPAPAAVRPKLHSSEPERHLTIVRQAMFRAHPFWYALMVLMFIGGLVLAIIGGTARSQVPNPPVLIWGGLALAVVAFLWWLVWWSAPHRWIKLTITTKRTIRQEGIIVRKTSEVLHNHIRNVKIEQSFMQRIFGVGKIAIDSAGGAEHQPIEIEMENVPSPYKVKDLIDKHRRL